MPANGQQPLGLRIVVKRYNRDGSTTDVLPDTVFHSGERIRLTVQPNARGYLYIANKGSSGEWQPMFPSPEIENGDNRTEAMHSYLFPSETQAFTFDSRVGQESLFVVFSRQPVQDFEELIYKLEARKKSGTQQKGMKAADPDEEKKPPKKLLVASATISDPAISRLRDARARDLIIETVRQDTPGPNPETALYMVNPTGSEDSSVVMDIKLVHQ